jgi:hypothetical protein
MQWKRELAEKRDREWRMLIWWAAAENGSDEDMKMRRVAN